MILMTGIQFVTNDKGRRVAVLIDLKKHGARLQDLWDGLVSELRRGEKGIPLEKIKADLIRVVSQFEKEVSSACNCCRQKAGPSLRSG
jgi:hypothetical protein